MWSGVQSGFAEVVGDLDEDSAAFEATPLHVLW